MSLALYKNDIGIPAVQWRGESCHWVDRTPILLTQNWQEGGVAAVVWDAALILTWYLQLHPYLIKGQRCLELGSGTGLVGLAAYALGAKNIVMTDVSSALPLLRANVIQTENIVQEKLYPLHFPSARRANTCPVVTELDWTNKGLSSTTKNNWDVILAADVIYDVDLHEPLKRTLKKLFSFNPKAQVLLATRVRYTHRDGAYLEKLSADFVMETLYRNANNVVIHKLLLRT